ncbi:MAG: serine hydrolase domain-containing protein [Actinoallomurus sp.]
MHVLAERGLLDYDTPVAEYWPEFGVRGKAGITLAHVLTHSAGVHNAARIAGRIRAVPGIGGSVDDR